jgi:hypothetical protein
VLNVKVLGTVKMSKIMPFKLCGILIPTTMITSILEMISLKKNLICSLLIVMPMVMNLLLNVNSSLVPLKLKISGDKITAQSVTDSSIVNVNSKLKLVTICL